MSKKKPFRAFNFACNKDEIELIQFIESQKNFTAYIKQLILNDMNGISPDNSNDIDQQLKKAKLTEANNKISLHSIKKRNIEADTKIKEYHAEHVRTIGSRPSALAERAIEFAVTGVEPPPSYDKDAIYCPDCTWRTNSKESIQWQINRITDHVRSSHNRSFTDDEAQIISELLV